MELRNIDYYGKGMSALRPVDPNIQKAVGVLRAVNHRLRQQMIDMLRESGGLSVTDIYIRLRLDQSVASQHLAVLRREGIVDTKRTGKVIFYTVNEDRIQHILSCCKRLV